MKLVFPNLSHEAAAKDFIAEFSADGSSSNGDGSLAKYLQTASYDAWLQKTRNDLDFANIQPGRVPAITYFAVQEEDNKIIGMLNVRLALNDFLRTEGGHIAYCIRPSERGNGYAKQTLRKAIDFCTLLGIPHLILCCNKENIASAKVIQSCGGKLDAEFYSETFDAVIQRYLIQ